MSGVSAGSLPACSVLPERCCGVREAPRGERPARWKFWARREALHAAEPIEADTLGVRSTGGNPMLKPLAFVLIVVALHLSVAAMAASRHSLLAPTSLPLLACDPAH